MSVKSAHFLIGRADLGRAFVGRGRDEFHGGLRTISTFLCELMVEIGHFPSWPLIEIQAVPFVRRNHLHGPAFPSANYGLADKLGLRLLELAHSWHEVFPELEL
jgi:hypothetical protein